MTTSCPYGRHRFVNLLPMWLLIPDIALEAVEIPAELAANLPGRLRRGEGAGAGIGGRAQGLHRPMDQHLMPGAARRRRGLARQILGLGEEGEGEPPTDGDHPGGAPAIGPEIVEDDGDARPPIGRNRRRGIAQPCRRSRPGRGRRRPGFHGNRQSGRGPIGPGRGRRGRRHQPDDCWRLRHRRRRRPGRRAPAAAPGLRDKARAARAETGRCRSPAPPGAAAPEEQRQRPGREPCLRPQPRPRRRRRLRRRSGGGRDRRRYRGPRVPCPCHPDTDEEHHVARIFRVICDFAIYFMVRSAGEEARTWKRAGLSWQ